MSPAKSKKKKSVSVAIKEVFQPAEPPPVPEPDPVKKIFFKEKKNPNESKWPKPKLKVPSIFLHEPIENFANHVEKILNRGDTKFFQPSFDSVYTKIQCVTFDDLKSFTQYLDKAKLPYHTFSHPAKRMMKVVIRGLPNTVDLNTLKEDLVAVGLPIERLHMMKTKEYEKKPFLVQVVLNNDEKGRKMLQVKKIYDKVVMLEPPIEKPKQCHHCQRWGHNQRFCHGKTKCVRCGGSHTHRKCPKPTTDPPQCANCGEGHTANFTGCSYCPKSEEYKMKKEKQLLKQKGAKPKPKEIVTKENYKALCNSAALKPKNTKKKHKGKKNKKKK